MIKLNNEIKFKSLAELYERLLPALRSKAREIHKKGMDYIGEEDIWNYLKNYKWTTSKALDLGDMVNDIFNIEVQELDHYVKEELKKYRRKPNQEEI